MKPPYVLLVLAAILLAGCIGGEPEPLPPELSRSTSPPAVEPEAPPAAQPTEPPEPAEPASQATSPAPSPHGSQLAQSLASKPTASAASEAPPQTESDDQWATEAEAKGIRRPAAVGMGKAGHGYGKDPVTYPLAAYCRAREKIAVNHIAKAMQLYKALKGHYPRTQQEFREEIIKANAIVLPVLPSGRKFYYDPDEAKLVVIQAR